VFLNYLSHYIHSIPKSNTHCQPSDTHCQAFNYTQQTYSVSTEYKPTIRIPYGTLGVMHLARETLRQVSEMAPKGLDSRLKLVFASPNNTTETHFIPHETTPSKSYYYYTLSHTMTHIIFLSVTYAVQLYSKPYCHNVYSVLYYRYV